MAFDKFARDALVQLKTTVAGIFTNSAYRPTPEAGSDLPNGAYYTSVDATDGLQYRYQRTAGGTGYTRGRLVYSKADVGLPEVDNTSDAAKAGSGPIANAIADAKANPSLTQPNVTAATAAGVVFPDGVARARTDGSQAISKLSVGFSLASPQVPSASSFVVSPLAAAPLTDYVAHLRQSVYTGDWTTRATVNVTATSGNVQWTIGGQSVSTAYNATAADVQAALQSLSTTGANTLTVTGGPGGASPYVVSYSPFYVASGGLFTGKALTVTGATLSWTNMWGVDTGFLFAENSYHVTGSTGSDGNNIAILYGGLYEVDIRSSATIGKMIGLSAEASFAGAGSTGYVGSVVACQINPILHKDGSSPQLGTAGSVVTLNVGGSQNSRTFTDGVINGTTSLTSASAQFSAIDTGKVITGAGIPAGTYIVSASATSVVMSQAASASAAGVSVSIKGTAQANSAKTAVFGAGDIDINGKTVIAGWADEVQLTVIGRNNQTSRLQEWRANGNSVTRIAVNGAIASNSGYTAFEGVSAQVNVGFVNGPGKAGASFGTPLDTSIYRDTVAVVGTGGAIRLGLGVSTGVANATPSAAGARLWSGAGVPGSVANSLPGAGSGDFYFRVDTPTVANQRLYINQGGTWVGIL